jgi:hypothetical protein
MQFQLNTDSIIKGGTLSGHNSNEIDISLEFS